MNGVNLEKQVEEILQENGWEILSNAYYKDPNTQIPREKDIIATKLQSLGSAPNYSARLFIECKNFPEQTEIYLKNTPTKDITNTILAFNIPLAHIHEIERNKKTHFYNYGEIYGSKDSKDYLHKAVNQNLQSLSAFRKHNSENAIYYLIVIFDGELLVVDQNKNKKTCTGALIQIDVLDDTFNLPNKKCFIEASPISQLDNLIKKIEKDIKEINSSVCFYHRMEQNKNEERTKRIRQDSCK